MNALDHVRWFVQSDKPAFFLFHRPDIDPAMIAAVIAARAGRPVVTARLRSDHLNPEEAGFIRENLLGERIVLLIAPDAPTLPAALVDGWEYYRQHADACDANAGPIRFSPADAPRARGILGVVVPRGYEGRRPEGGRRVFVETVDDLGGMASEGVQIVELGRPRVRISMKELCLLHHRDPEGVQHHGSVSEIMERSQRPLTWRDLQMVLSAQADRNMRAILEAFEHGRRISAAQLDLAVEAIDYLREETLEQERIGAHALNQSIYHALWIYGPLLEARGFVFRGQSSSRWRQDSSLFRSEPDGTAPSLATLVDRLWRTQAFLDALAAEEQGIVGRTLTDDERLAIAQHYGLPTALLDYTHSLPTAAFFATGAGDGSRLHEGDVGLIYYLRPSDPVARPPRSQIAGGIDFARAAGLQLGALETIAPELPDEENRIARQQGLFVAGFESRDLQRLAIGVIYFRQHPGEAFEDERLGITRGRLLPPDSRLQRIADGVSAKAPRLSTRLASARIPGDDIFGALGLDLHVTLSHGQGFLDAAAERAEHIERGLWESLRTIVERHLERARIQTRTSEVAASVPGEQSGTDQRLDAVDLALEELAALAGLPRDTLRHLLWEHRPGVSLRPTPGRVGAPIEPPAEGPRARLALALGLFIVGLEHLRTVHGEVARQYMQQAESTLDENGW